MEQAGGSDKTRKKKTGAPKQLRRAALAGQGVAVQICEPPRLMSAPDYEAIRRTDEKQADVALHAHAFYELYLVVSGYVTCALEGRVYRMGPGDAVTIGPACLHRMRTDPDAGPHERYILRIAPELLRKLSSAETDLGECFLAPPDRPGNKLCLSGSSLDLMCRLMDLLCRERVTDRFGADILAGGILTSLLTTVNRIAREQGGDEMGETYPNPLVSSVIEYLGSHYSEDLTLDRLAERFYVSKYHLSHVFGEQVGIGVYQYLQKKRLARALKMLADGNRPIEVSFLCGFGDYSSFYRAFRSEYGMSPRSFARVGKNE